MSNTVFSRLCSQLDAADVAYEVSRHEAVFTSEEAAAVRGATLASGAKALICKANKEFTMFVMPADRRLDSKRVRKEHALRGLRFANGEEVLELTGLKPGSIPPFGSLFGLATWCDQRLADEERINFNAGDHCISINMRFTDFCQVESPRMAEIAQ